MKQAFGQEELHQREAVCTREEPPGCQAACPLHLDMRAVCGHEARGDFKKAAAVIRQTTPFLYLLARTCSAPCQKACTPVPAGRGSAGTGSGTCLRSVRRPCRRKPVSDPQKE